MSQRCVCNEHFLYMQCHNYRTQCNLSRLHYWFQSSLNIIEIPKASLPEMKGEGLRVQIWNQSWRRDKQPLIMTPHGSTSPTIHVYHGTTSPTVHVWGRTTQWGIEAFGRCYIIPILHASSLLCRRLQWGCFAHSLVWTQGWNWEALSRVESPNLIKFW